jgi:hypothetical protein
MLFQEETMALEVTGKVTAKSLSQSIAQAQSEL